jgi:hypothetical protein
MTVAPGDRTHIPNSLRPIYNVVSQQLNQIKEATPVRVPVCNSLIDQVVLTDRHM